MHMFQDLQHFSFIFNIFICNKIATNENVAVFFCSDTLVKTEFIEQFTATCLWLLLTTTTAIWVVQELCNPPSSIVVHLRDCALCVVNIPHPLCSLLLEENFLWAAGSLRCKQGRKGTPDNLESIFVFVLSDRGFPLKPTQTKNSLVNCMFYVKSFEH